VTAAHETLDAERDGFPAVELRSPGGLVATFVPGSGMVCCSLTHDGEELLGQRGGLRAYHDEGGTMGIPLLHPWANRLDGMGYSLDGVDVVLDAGSPGVEIDPATGLPIHGLVAACRGWRAESRDHGECARLEASLDFAALERRAPLFPFPHVLRMTAELRGSVLRITTTLTATGERRVPVAFGFHPYFRLPGVERSQWRVGLPVRRRAVLDERSLPTGRTEECHIPDGPLGERTYDDLFPELEPDPVFTLAGGGRMIEVAFEAGYPVGVVYAPDDDEVICFEPMTAQTNPFADPGSLAWVAPGDSYSATFSVSVGR
jgi:galactose mutarotase-like enzyme